MPSSNKIKDLPAESRPREKLLNQGAKTLSDAELLAIFLRVGMRGKSAIQLGQELINTSGGLGQLSFMSASQLSKLEGLGPAKAAQLIATFELGERAAKQRLVSAKIDSPEELYKLIQPLIGNRPTETLIVILVDVKLRYLGMKELSQGTKKQTLASIPEVLHEVLIAEADGFFLAHNHPSGDPKPSQADRDLTQRVREASKIMSLKFHDHLIVGKADYLAEGYYSFSENS